MEFALCMQMFRFRFLDFSLLRVCSLLIRSHTHTHLKARARDSHVTTTGFQFHWLGVTFASKQKLNSRAWFFCGSSLFAFDPSLSGLSQIDLILALPRLLVNQLNIRDLKYYICSYVLLQALYQGMMTSSQKACTTWMVTIESIKKHRKSSNARWDHPVVNLSVSKNLMLKFVIGTFKFHVFLSPSTKMPMLRKCPSLFKYDL